MFVSNTGACAMICPIAEALVEELYHVIKNSITSPNTIVDISSWFIS